MSECRAVSPKKKLLSLQELKARYEADMTPGNFQALYDSMHYCIRIKLSAKLRRPNSDVEDHADSCTSRLIERIDRKARSGSPYVIHSFDKVFDNEIKEELYGKKCRPLIYSELTDDLQAPQVEHRDYPDIILSLLSLQVPFEKVVSGIVVLDLMDENDLRLHVENMKRIHEETYEEV